MDQPRDTMDRKRLKQIEQSDLTEGRLNQDFVYWLKTKGPNWLLVVLAALCVYMVVVRWKQHGVQKSAEAWEALASADLPRSLEDVAAEYDTVDAVPELALMQAGRRYLQSVRAGHSLSAAVVPPADPNQPAPAPPPSDPLTDQQRTEYLNEASRLFQAALDEVNANRKNVAGEALMLAGIYEGLASVAESKGDEAAATDYYKKAAEAAEADFPRIAEQARARSENVASTVQTAPLPTLAETGTSALRRGFTADEPSPITLSPSLQSIIEGDGATPSPADDQAASEGE